MAYVLVHRVVHGEGVQVGKQMFKRKKNPRYRTRSNLVRHEMKVGGSKKRQKIPIENVCTDRISGRGSGVKNEGEMRY